MIPRYSRPEMARLWTDEYRFQKMLEVEILTCEALAKKGVIPKKASEKIRKKARVHVDQIRALERVVKHDVVAFVTQVGETVGPESRYIHMGLTSSDVLDTALAVQLVEASRLLEEDLSRVIGAVGDLARRHKLTPMVGRTHGVHAEPITFGFKLAGWYSELLRARDRLERVREHIRYGKLSGAVGTFAHLDPSVEAYVCQKLGLQPEPVATQAVPRDRHAEFVATLAVIASSLERFAVEIRHLQRTEVLEAEEPFTEGQKGSSAMPHKRNPIACENLCGLARLMRSYAQAALEDVALWHERDISHSSVERVILPDSTILLDFMLNRFTEVLTGLQVYPENMKKNLEQTSDLVASQRVLLQLVEGGASRDQAYQWVQRNALQAWKTKESFRDLLLWDPDIRKRMTQKQLESCFDTGYYLRHMDAIFRRIGL